MVFLRFVKFGQRNKFSNERLVPHFGAVDFLDHFFGNFLLLFAGVKDHRSVLGSRRLLPACSGGRVVHREKHLENFAISNDVQDQRLPAQLPHVPFRRNILLHKSGFSCPPPAYPDSTFRTPLSSEYTASRHQKQPPPRVAI